MAEFGDGGTPNAEVAFRNSFGYNIGHGAVYSDPAGWRGSPVDLKSSGLGKDLELQMKAVTTTMGGAGTAGYAMIPIYVDPRITDTTRKYTPIVELTPRVANMGTTADYNRLTAKGGAVFAAEDAALTETNDTYARSSTAIKYLYSVGRVTGPSQAAFPAYSLGGFTQSAAPTAKQLEVVVKTRSLRELEENAIVNGSTGTTATWFDGIIQTQSTTNKVDKNTAALSLDDLYTAVQYAFDDGGRPNLAICSSSVYTDINNLMLDQMRYAPTAKLAWGFETLAINTMVGQVPLVPSMYMSNTSGSKAIYFLDMSEIEMRVLQDVTYEELAKTADSEKFMLKVYESWIDKSTGFNGYVGEIA